MRKLLYVIILISFPLFSCFQDTQSEIRLSINNTGSSPYLHIAAFDGDTVLEQISIDTSKGVSDEFYVPSDTTITFVILGENSGGEIDYYGTKTIVPRGDNTISETISTALLQGIIDPARYDGNGSYISWNRVTGGTIYNIYNLQGDDWVLIYSGADEIFNTTLYTFEFTVDFDFVNKVSILLNVPYYQI